MPEITVTVIFHRERAFAVPALASLLDMVSVARRAGLTVEARAMLDRADSETRHLVAARGDWLDEVEEVSFGDPALTRNAGVRSARGRFVSFLDGDDLWGDQWLRLAYLAATGPDAPTEAIWHPENVFFFHEGDFDRHSINDAPHPEAKSFHFLHQSSRHPEFDRRLLSLCNFWSANAFASRLLHMRHPYDGEDSVSGFGVEDWCWNLKTVWDGIPHLVVPDAVHLVRKKDTGSLGQRHAVEGLLPILPENLDLLKPIPA